MANEIFIRKIERAIGKPLPGLVKYILEGDIKELGIDDINQLEKMDFDIRKARCHPQKCHKSHKVALVYGCEVYEQHCKSVEVPIWNYIDFLWEPLEKGNNIRRYKKQKEKRCI